MKKISTLILSLVLVFQLHAQNQQMDSFVGNLMKKMTLEEKIGQLNQLAIPNSFVTGATVSTDVEGKIIAGNVGSILNSLNPEVTRKVSPHGSAPNNLRIPSSRRLCCKITADNPNNPRQATTSASMVKPVNSLAKLFSLV